MLPILNWVRHRSTAEPWALDRCIPSSRQCRVRNHRSEQKPWTKGESTQKASARPSISPLNQSRQIRMGIYSSQWSLEWTRRCFWKSFALMRKVPRRWDGCSMKITAADSQMPVNRLQDDLMEDRPGEFRHSLKMPAANPGEESRRGQEYPRNISGTGRNNRDT
jgi:hypothetical protein